MTKLNVQKLEDIGKLPDNWNGYGARKFAPSLINKCREIAKNLPIEMTVYPTGRQSIQFQYDKNENYLELEVYEDHTFCLCMLLKMLHISCAIVFGRDDDLQKSKKSPTSK